MTKHEELERDAENLARSLLPMTARVARRDDREGSAKTCEVAASTILALLSANREMREAANLVLDTNDRIVDAMLAANDERTAASISLKGADEFTATLAVLRSALTTQRGDGE